MNEEEAPSEQKKTLSLVPSPTTNLFLPDDILLSSLSRISRLYYPTFSLVSKSFRSLIASPELYQTRSILGRTESCLYVSLRLLNDSNLRWYTLCRVPDRKLTNFSGGHLLVPILSRYAPPAHWSSVVAVDYNIYAIGGPINDAPSSSVSVLDCQCEKWREAPSMRVARNYPTATVLDGKIYVAGGCEDVSKWVEVFDPKTQTWGSVMNPGIDKRDRGEIKSLGLDGKFYQFGDEFFVYDPKEGRWNTIGLDSDMAYVAFFSYCVVDGVLFFWNDEVFHWYDSKASLWKKLNGVEGLPEFFHCLMVGVGGKMMVLWDESVYYSSRRQENVIWCAEISLERRGGDGDEIWGTVEWFDAVLPVHKSCRLLDADGFSATL